MGTECDERPDVAHVEIGISGENVEPEKLTAATALMPSRAWSKDEVYASKAPGIRKRPYGIWVITAKGTRVEPCALELLARIEPHADVIRGMARDACATISIGIWWEPSGGRGGFTVSADVFRQLLALCDRVDVYFPG